MCQYTDHLTRPLAKPLSSFQSEKIHTCLHQRNSPTTTRDFLKIITETTYICKLNAWIVDQNTLEYVHYFAWTFLPTSWLAHFHLSLKTVVRSRKTTVSGRICSTSFHLWCWVVLLSLNRTPSNYSCVKTAFFLHVWAKLLGVALVAIFADEITVYIYSTVHNEIYMWYKIYKLAKYTPLSKQLPLMARMLCTLVVYTGWSI